MDFRPEGDWLQAASSQKASDRRWGGVNRSLIQDGQRPPRTPHNFAWREPVRSRMPEGPYIEISPFPAFCCLQTRGATAARAEAIARFIGEERGLTVAAAYRHDHTRSRPDHCSGRAPTDRRPSNLG